MDSHEILNLRQTAALLQVSYDHLWLKIRDGHPHPPFFLIGKSKRFVRAQVLEWAKEQAENQGDKQA